MKRTLSLFLSLLMVFSLFTGLNISAGAVEAEVSEAAAEAEVIENVTETQPLENDLPEPEPEPEPETVAQRIDEAAVPQIEKRTRESDLAETGASYGLWVGSAQVTDANKNDILGDGGKAKFDSSTHTLTLNNPTITGEHNDSTIYCNGFDLTVNGSYTMTAAQSDNALTVFDYGLTLDGNFTFLAWSYAVEASYDINVIGGRVIAKLEDSAYAQNIAFCSDVGNLIFGDNVEYFEAEITDTGRASCAIGYDTSGTVTLSPKLKLSEPEGGRFSDGACVYTEGTKQKWAKKVVIEPANPSDVKYDVWVGSTQVTAANKNNILNDGGKAKYDPSTATLTLNNPTISTGYSDGSYTYKIYAEDDFTVKGSYTMTSYSTDYGIDCYTNLTLDGNFTFLGYRYGVYARLTLTVNGSLTGRMNSTTTTLSNAAGITADEIEFEEITRVEAEGKKVYGIYAARGLTIPPEYEISVPTASYIDKGTVVDNTASQIAKRVVITPVVGGLGVFLGEKQVTESNAADIYGDGKASYDKETKTLTLNYPSIRGCYTNEWGDTIRIYSKDDLTITGSYNSIDMSYNYGIRCGGNLTLNADIIRIGASNCAIYAWDKLVINGVGSGEITAKSNGTAIYVYDELEFGTDVAKVEAEGAKAAVSTGGIKVGMDMYLSYPEKHVTKSGIVYESDGETKAKKVVFSRYYRLWLGDTVVTDANKNDILGDGGKAKYNPKTQTLTLNDPVIPHTDDEDTDEVLFSDGIDLTIRGSYHMTEAEYGYGFRCPDGSLTLNGDFTIMGQSCGIIASGGMTIRGGTVTATSVKAFGIYAFTGDIVITGGSVTATSAEEDAIFAEYGNITVTGGSVTANSTDKNGIKAEKGNISITGGSVTATGKFAGIYTEKGSVTVGTTVESVTATGKNYGIRANNGFTDKGGKVTATSEDSGGIFTGPGDINIIGGSVSATSANESGIVAYRGNINIIGGSVSATGNKYAVYAYGDILIEGGSLRSDSDYLSIYSDEGSVTIGASVDNVTATGRSFAIYASNNVTINGGSITLTSAFSFLQAALNEI